MRFGDTTVNTIATARGDNEAAIAALNAEANSGNSAAQALAPVATQFHESRADILASALLTPGLTSGQLAQHLAGLTPETEAAFLGLVGRTVLLAFQEAAAAELVILPPEGHVET